MGRNRNNSSWLVDQRCKKHPSHKQSKGVCPSCLREKLSRLSSYPSSSSSAAINRSSSCSCSSLSPCSLTDSDLSSLAGSPHHIQQHQHKSFSFMFMISGGKALKKSRSLAFVEKEKSEKKKRGFLSKLINGKKKEKDVVGELTLHSKTLKGRSSTNIWGLLS